MKKWAFRKLLLCAAGLLLLSGCSEPALSGEQQRELVPYTLRGSQGGWEIRCEVRELTVEEKNERLAEWEKSWAEEDALLSSKGADPETCEAIQRQRERQKRDWEGKKAYLSCVYGLCRDEGLEGKPFDYRLVDGNNRKLLSGTQAASPEEGQWYASAQTEGDLFIPPLQEAALVVKIGGEEIRIPLELSAGAGHTTTETELHAKRQEETEP